MNKRLEFEEVVRIDDYGLIIYFNDSTHAKFTVEELAHMRPVRDASDKIKTSIGNVNE